MARPKGKTMSDADKAIRQITQIVNFSQNDRKYSGLHVKKALDKLNVDAKDFDLHKHLKGLEKELASMDLSKPVKGASAKSKTDADREIAAQVLRSGAKKLIGPNWDGDSETLLENMTHFGKHVARYCYNLGPKAGKDANQEAMQDFAEEIAP
ncbi:MAG: hypothetical protein ACK2U9_15485, partial [Anaerolineae bacterium]